MSDKIIRVITRASNGSLRTKEFEDLTDVEGLYDKIGIDDCSTDLTLRGLPVFRGLVGPMPESKTVAKYESPEVFESLTKEWAQRKTKRRRRKKSEIESEAKQAEEQLPVKPKPTLMPKLNMGSHISSPTVSL